VDAVKAPGPGDGISEQEVASATECQRARRQFGGACQRVGAVWQVVRRSVREGGGEEARCRSQENGSGEGLGEELGKKTGRAEAGSDVGRLTKKP